MKFKISQSRLESSSLSLLKNRNFLLFWTGTSITLVAEGISRIVFLWWILQKTGQALTMGLLMIVSVLPELLIGPFAGVFVDRWNRRNVIVVCDLITGVAVLSLAGLEYTGYLQLWHLYLFSAFFSFISPFYSAAELALMPQIVPKDQLIRANALEELSTNGSNILGLALGGLLIAVVDIAGALLIEGVAVLITVIFEMCIRVSAPKREKSSGVILSLKKGLRYLRDQKIILGMCLIFALVSFAGMPIFIMLPLFADRIYQVGPAGLGWMEASIGAGSLLATVFLYRYPLKRRYWILQSSLLLMGVFFLLLGLSIGFPIFLIFLSCMGFFFAVINILAFSYYQTVVPESKLGLIVSIISTLILSVYPLSYGLGGLSGDVLGIRPTMMVCGIGILVGAFLFVFIPKIRTI